MNRAIISLRPARNHKQINRDLEMGKFINIFQDKIRQRKLKIAVVGLGYVGLPLAVDFAKKGFSVLGLDLDKDRVNRINKRQSYIIDVTTKDLCRVISSGKLKAENDFRLLRNMDVVLICVPTPLKKKYSPDISFIKSAVNSIAKNINKNTLVILESTTYTGTTEEVILPIFEQYGLKHDSDFYLCFSPERIDPGNIRYPLAKIPKVIGGISKEATCLGVAIYSSIINKVIPVSSTRVAETVKLLENTFRIINIGLIDELAMMCHKMNINIWEVINAAKTKPFGFMPFYPGPGVGGHCIPKDPLYLYWKAKKYGFSSRFIKLASEVINDMPEYVVSRLGELLLPRGKNIKTAKFLIVGVTYKKDVKDLRKSPALDIIGILKEKKAGVSYYDPLIPYLHIHGINLKSINLNKNILAKFDCVVIVSDHSCIDYEFLLKSSRLIFDTRNVYKGVQSNKLFRL